jgi:hypothetical protein
MREAWALIEDLWRATTDRARHLPVEALSARVNGEWSFVETLRHLVFATDAWFRRPVLGLADPYWIGDLPHTEFGGDPSGLGIDANSSRPLAEVLVVRDERWAEVRSYLAGVSENELSRTCAQNPVSGYPSDTQVTVRGCLGVVLNEEWWHHQFATRDLTVLEA